jgi:hypothetical protein
MSGTEPAKSAVINESGDEGRVPLVGWKKSSVIFTGGAAAVGYLLASQLGALFRIPGIIFGTFIGVIVVYSTPSHLSVWQALKDGLNYLSEPKYIYSASDPHYATDGGKRNEGGIVSYTPLQPDTRTQDLTSVKLALPGADAVLTKGGKMEAMIEVHGDNMDFAPPAEWATKQEIGANFADREVSEEVKVHATTQQFKFDEIIERLDDRLEAGFDEPDDPDRTKKGARELLRDYRENRPDEIKERGTQEVRYFIVVSVSRNDVLQKYANEETPVEQASTAPIVGPLIQRLRSDETVDMTDEEIREEMVDRLDDRVQSVKNELIAQTEGYDPDRLTAAEIMIMLARQFNGNQTELHGVESAINTKTVVGSSRRDTDLGADGPMGSGGVSLRSEGETK